MSASSAPVPPPQPTVDELKQGFTPGPWLSVKEPGDEWWFGGRDGAQIVIRPVDGPSYVSIGVLGCTDSGDPQQEANAHLIAAAPELLGALEVMTEFAAATIERLKLTDTNGIVAGSRAILARARGEGL